MMSRPRYVLALCSALLLAATAGGIAARPPGLQLGRLTLQPCQTHAPWCGSLLRRLEPGSATGRLIPVYFEYYPHTGGGPAAGTLVATEGGPGYPATGSRRDYLALFAPLRTSHDVLIMDNRGTGHSAAIDCEPLQNAPQLTEADIGACGRSLGRSAPLYSTALAADDLAALLDELAIARIDLYGDSYGTYFAQVFALRHPQQLRSLVLDGAYPLDGPDYPWYPHYAAAMRDKFNRACARATGCRAIPGSSLEHLAPALEALRRAPFSAAVRYGGGRVLHFTADASALAIVMFGGSPALETVRETDAAARAFSDGDRVPLLRLMAEALSSVDSRGPSRSPRQFSAGLAAAVFCHDPPQIFDMRLPTAERLRERDRQIARRRTEAPGTYAPFSIDEYRGMPLDYAFIDECVQWPPAPPDAPVVPLVPAHAVYPDVPVLVISGEFDNMTSVADGAAAAARFPHAHHVIIANSFHVNALPHARSECAAMLVRRFIADSVTGDESCAAAVPELRLVTRFARRTHELPAARALAANEAGEEELRAVSAALASAADVLARADAGERGVGLRGGSFASAPGSAGLRLSLHEVRWTEDCVVSGRLEAPARSGTVRAVLTLRGAAQGDLQLEWSREESQALATVHGVLNGRSVAAEAPAP
jgi:pimeloyl-ACP methyl ester carboxylesterase